jgi:hypothetical protein
MDDHPGAVRRMVGDCDARGDSGDTRNAGCSANDEGCGAARVAGHRSRPAARFAMSNRVARSGASPPRGMHAAAASGDDQ